MTISSKKSFCFINYGQAPSDLVNAPANWPTAILGAWPPSPAGFQLSSGPPMLSETCGIADNTTAVVPAWVQFSPTFLAGLASGEITVLSA